MKISILCVFLLSILLLTCQKKTEDSIVTEITSSAITCPSQFQEKGARILGHDILDISETGNFNDNIEKAKTMGLGAISLHVLWSDIEATPNNYTDPSNALSSLDAVASDNNLKLSLTIRPIDLTGKTVPADLEDQPKTDDRFSTNAMINRFTSMLDYILNNFVTPSNLLSLQIGNEIDGYDTSNEHEDFWSDYGAFLFGIRNWLNANYPSIKVGVTLTHKGATSGTLRDAGVWTSLAGIIDIIGITYYPIDHLFNVLNPDVVTEDLTTLVSEFKSTGKAIYLQEIGYQTSSTNFSNQNKQAQFFCHFFQSWDTHKEDIPYAMIVRLVDLSNTRAKELATPYGNENNLQFVEYLRTLGLSEYAGTQRNKNVINILQSETQKRGF